MQLRRMVGCLVLVGALVLGQRALSGLTARAKEPATAVYVAEDDGDNVGRPPRTPLPPKPTPTPSSCPRLSAQLQRVIAILPATPTTYPPSLIVEDGRVQISLSTSADDAYLRDTYDVDVKFRLRDWQGFFTR